MPPLRTLSIRLVAVAALGGLLRPAQAVDYPTAPDPPPDLVSQPLEPADALRSLVVPRGLKVELVAHEPQVVDPVAFAWGPDGKFWVVEMRDYPLGLDGRGRPGGQVKYLDDSDGDGRFDRAVTFLDGLTFPTSVLPWRRGVLVCAVPEIFYAVDVDGDGRADRRETLYEGLHVGNPQHLANGLRYGFDGWIHCANGATRTGVTSTKTGATVDVGTRDFRIHPDTGAIEPLVGRSQCLRETDDAGNWFGSSNSNPLYHFTLDDRVLRRNPLAVYPSGQVDVSETPGASQVFPLSRTVSRFNDLNRAGRFTSACSGMIYRDTLLGAAYAGNSFVCEPVHNLIHREVVRPAGHSFRSTRAASERSSEFLASTDNWFRPTMVRTGPDGALWVADMYRLVIEHPEWIPKSWQAKLDLRAGADRGRIYRIVPESAAVPPLPRLDRLGAAELVKALESPSGTLRDLARQQIVERCTSRDERTFDTARIVDELIRLIDRSPMAAARLQALATLASLDDELDTHVVRRCLADVDPAVRRGALRFLTPPMFPLDAQLLPAVVAAAGDSDLGVGMQAAAVLGDVDDPRTAAALADWLAEHADEPDPRAVGVSSLNARNLSTVARRWVARGGDPRTIVAALIDTAAGLGDRAALDDLVRAVVAGDRPPLDRRRAAAALLDGLARHRKSLDSLRQGASSETAARLDALQRLISEARATVGDAQASIDVRAAALELFGRRPTERDAERAALAELLNPRMPDALQSAAVVAATRIDDVAMADLLLGAWPSLSPARKSQVLDVCLARGAWSRRLLDAIAAGSVPAAELDAARTQQLLNHRDASLRSRAGEVLKSTINADRRRVVEQFAASIPATGDPGRGREVFVKTCANCHKLGDVGLAVGPDLAALSDKSPVAMLTSIFDPNRAVESKYVSYTAETSSGLTFTGVLVEESSNAVTLAPADGTRRSIARADLESFRSTGKSFMPEGIEKDLTPEKLADLLAFVGAARPPRKKFAGNEPRTVRPEALRGEFYLLGTEAAVYGETLVFEPKFANLGYWQSAADRAEWTIDVPREGDFEVALEYACAPQAGGAFVVEFDAARLSGTVEPTASWETYRSAAVGVVRLRAGVQAVIVRADGPPRGALFDLKSVRIKPR